MTEKNSTPPLARESLALFIALNLADFCTTACIIRLGGVEVFVHKLFVAAGLGYLCRNFTKKWWDLLNGLFTGVVMWNTIQLCLFVKAVIDYAPA